MNEVTLRIDRMRQDKGWTVYKLAQESGVGAQTIYNWNATDTYPLFPALKQICDAFGVTVANFLADGNMVELTPDKKELNNDWDILDAEERVAVRSVIKGYVKRKRG